MDKEFPAGMLHNTSNDRYYPIVFRRAPMPGNVDETMSAQRYKSVGHHTEGFDTRDQAMAHITGEPRFDWCKAEWEWEGVDVPALVVYIVPRKGDTPPKVALG